MKKRTLIALTLGCLLLAACGAEQKQEETTPMTYTQITQEEAQRIMREEEGYLIVDVRRSDEFAEGHIPGAVLVTLETIGAEMPAQLPDKDQKLLVYCRSGRRSKEAAQKLADLGYSQVYEFGGILTWPGEITRD